MKKCLIRAAASVLTVASVFTAGILVPKKTVNAASSNELIDKVCRVAKSEVGYKEKKNLLKLPNGSINYNALNEKASNAGSGNVTKYAQWFTDNHANFYWGNKQGVEWCDVFVDWCMCQAFGYKDACKITNQDESTNRGGAACSYSESYYKSMNRLYTTNPQKGDQVFFKSSNGHTGIIVAVNGNKYTVVEGNCGDQVKENVYTGTSNFKSYGRPKYESLATGTVTPPTNVDRAGAESFVKNLYVKCLGRNPSKAEVDSWVNNICNGSTASNVVWQFFNSPEFSNLKLSKGETIKRLYRAVLGREADTTGYNNWLNSYNKGASLKSIVQGIVNSAEFQSVCNKYGITRGTL